ncbi:MAG: cation diffusion facilitator family transporter [Nitrospirota bacterium]|nr:cation diffusion facilitator family transporter [Nitrospirota bacterium]
MSTLASYAHLRSRLYLALALNAVIIAAEFIGGWLLDSIGLMSDAGHNFVDQGALFLALYAHLLTAKPATEAKTFGYHRAGIIAAFLNSFLLLLTTVGITLVAFTRLLHPPPVDGGWIMAIAALSFAANLTVALLLQRGAKDDLNIRSAFWHMLGDAWVSLGIVISGGAIVLTGWTLLDPLISLLVVVVIARGAWPLFKESLDVLLESTPPKISAAHVAATIEAVAGVKNVHDLHIWAVEPRLIMMTCHILVDGDDSALTNHLLHTIRDKVSMDFGINHMTIQMGTHCCHADEIHCDLTALAMEHKDKGLVHVHH